MANKRKPKTHVRGRRVEINTYGEEAAAALSEAQLPGPKAPTAEQIQKLDGKLELNETKRKLVTDDTKETIARAKETQHLDPLAMSIARRLKRLPDEKLSVTLPHLLKYIDDLGLSKRATAQTEMFEPEPDELAGQTDLEVAISETTARQVATIGDNTDVGTPRLRIIDETGRDVA